MYEIANLYEKERDEFLLLKQVFSEYKESQLKTLNETISDDSQNNSPKRVRMTNERENENINEEIMDIGIDNEENEMIDNELELIVLENIQNDPLLGEKNENNEISENNINQQ